MTTRIRIVKPRATRGRVGWLKVVESVDRTQKNGYAFDGDFLQEGLNDLRIGAVVIQCEPTGSLRHPAKEFSVGCVVDGKIKWLETGNGWTRSWDREDFLDFRDLVAEMVDGDAGKEAARRVAIAEIKALMKRHDIGTDEL